MGDRKKEVREMGGSEGVEKVVVLAGRDREWPIWMSL